jgi:hypothetical protein
MNKAKEIFDLRKQQESVFKKDFLTVKADHKLYKINYADIKYIEGMREYVSFYFGNGRVTALLSLKITRRKVTRRSIYSMPQIVYRQQIKSDGTRWRQPYFRRKINSNWSILPRQGD